MNDVLFTALVDKTYEFSVSKGELAGLDCYTEDGVHFHILDRHRSLDARVESFDSEQRAYVIQIGGDRFKVVLKDQHDMLVDRLGLTQSAATAASDVYAPMPGMVLEVLVETGQSVESGQPVLILEAMKMENIIKTASAGTVEILNATQGDSVEKGQLLVVLKPNDQ